MFNSEIILTKFSEYLDPKTLVSFSSINKTIYNEKLNPKCNCVINSLFRYLVFKLIYFNEFEEDIGNNNNKKEEIIDDYNVTKTDWKKIYLELSKHYHRYNYKIEYVKGIFERFKIHLYLPFLRKKNYILEQKESSLHLYFCYDFNKNNKFICNHYDKYLDLNNNGFNGLNSDNFIIRTQLYFENEFVSFNDLLRNVFLNDRNIILIEKIINYDYKGIEDFYCKNNYIIINNPVLDFVIWLNHCGILFAQILHNKMKIYCGNDKNKFELIKEYTQIQNNFINFSLAVNEQYNNLNIIMNYFYRFIKDKTKQYYQFSLYKMLFNIMKNEIFEKNKIHLEKEFKKLVQQYCKESFNIDDNQRKFSFDSGTKPDSDDSFEENDDLEMIESDTPLNDEEKELSKKDIIDNFMKCILDLNIDEKNSLGINHSNLKMDDNYLIYENILINTFVIEIENCIKENNSITNILQTVKSLFSINDEYYKQINMKNYNGFKFIRRTKKLIMKKIEECLENNIYKNIITKFNDYIEKDNKNDKNKIIFIDINKNLNELIGECTQEEKFEMDKIYSNKVEQIKMDLINNINTNKNFVENVNKIEIVNNYLENVSLDYFVILKEIICAFFVEKKLYVELDKKVINILNSFNSNKKNI